MGVVSPLPNPQAGGPPLVGCPQLLIQYIHSYPPYLEAFSSIRNLSMCHAVVTRDPHNVVIDLIIFPGTEVSMGYLNLVHTVLIFTTL
jgi:hypothetical protein